MNAPSQAVSRVLGKLKKVKKASGGGWTARCPGHADRTPSLKIDEGEDGRCLLRCHAGCSVEAILAKVGLTSADLFDEPIAKGNACRLVATHIYTDLDGAEIFYRDRCEWYEGGERHKAIYPRQLDGTKKGMPPVPYKLHQVAKATAAGGTVLFVEGEKCADVLAERRYVATTTGGATSWHRKFVEYFRGAHVVLWPDADSEGEAYIAKVAHDLAGIAASIRVIRFEGKPDGWDAADFFAEGGTPEELDHRLEDASAWAEAPKPEATVRPLSLAWWLTHPELLKLPMMLVASIIWEGRSTILSGLPKAGKSTLAALIAAKLSVGGNLFGQQLAAASVLWLALDEYVGDALRRLRDYGADPERVFVHDKRPENTAELVTWVDALDVKLVIIDTTTRWWLGIVKKSNDAEEVRAFLAPYLDAMRERGVALLILHHCSKAGLRASGSVALEAEPDVCLVLVHPSQRKLLNASGTDQFDEDDPPDDGKRIVQGTSRFSPHIKIKLRYEGDRFVEDSAADTRRGRILRAAAEPGGPFLKGELAKRTGGKRKDTLELIDELVLAGELVVAESRYSRPVDGGLDVAI